MRLVKKAICVVEHFLDIAKKFNILETIHSIWQLTEHQQFLSKQSNKSGVGNYPSELYAGSQVPRGVYCECSNFIVTTIYKI